MTSAPTDPLPLRFVLAAWAASLAGLSPTTWAQLPVPELWTVFPAGGQRGTSVTVTLTGANLEQADAMVFSHPGITGQATQAEGARFDVQIAAGVPSGIYEARFAGTLGVSNPRAFVVGHLEETAQTEASKRQVAAQPIGVGATINGRVDAAARDYYRLKLRRGQRVVIECLAERIDSRLDGTLSVRNAAGRLLASNRDSVGRDPLIDFTAPAHDEYLIVVYDSVYRGGADYFYRLSVHNDAYIDYVFPPCGLPGTNNVLEIFGRNLPGGQPANVRVDGAPLQRSTTSVELPADEGTSCRLGFGDRVAPPSAFLDGFEYRLGESRPVRLGRAQAPLATEAEPNNSPAEAQVLNVPCDVAGQFYPAGDVDWYCFEAESGHAYCVEVFSHRLGLDTDPCLVVQKVTRDSAGQEQVTELASVDDSANRAARIGGDFDASTDDPSYRLAVAESGTYRVMVRDQFGGTRSDPRAVYRLVIRAEQPDFRLVAVPSPLRPGAADPQQTAATGGLVLPRGGSAVLEVVAARQEGFTGEIELSVEDLPPGASCTGAILGGPVESAPLVLTADENAMPRRGTLRVVGRARIGDREVQRDARHGACVWGTANRQQQPPVFRAARDLWLSVTDQSAVPVSVQVGDGKVVEATIGTRLEVPVKVARRGGFSADVVLTAVGTPAEIKPDDVTVKADATDGVIAFDLTKPNTAPGGYTVYWKTDVKHQVAGPDGAVKELTTAWASTPLKLRLLPAPSEAKP